MRHAIPSFKQRQEFHRPFWNALRRALARKAERIARALQPATCATSGTNTLTRV